MKNPTYKYRGCNKIEKGLTTTSRCTADAKIGFENASKTGALIDEMIKDFRLKFETLGYDISTIKFDISLKQ